MRINPHYKLLNLLPQNNIMYLPCVVDEFGIYIRWKSHFLANRKNDQRTNQPPTSTPIPDNPPFRTLSAAADEATLHPCLALLDQWSDTSHLKQIHAHTLRTAPASSSTPSIDTSKLVAFCAALGSDPQPHHFHLQLRH